VSTLWRKWTERAMRSPIVLSLVSSFRRARRRMIQTGAVIRRRVVAHGRVQGVFFRDTCRRQASTRQVSGWVANREDGAVEAVFEGEPSDVQAMVDWARRGPYQAHVTKLEVIEEAPRGELGFSVR
jgi:acylphosphatase